MRTTALVAACFGALLLLAVPASAAVPASPWGEEAPPAVVPESGPPAPDGGGLRSGTPADLLNALLTGADYLQAMQADVTEDNAGNGFDGAGETPDDPDDGGWDWVVQSPPAPVFHTTAASPTNIYGATGQGLYSAYLVSNDPGYFTALIDAADVMAANPSIRSAADVIFLMMVDDLPGVPGTTYQDAAKAKYDGRIATYGSATALAEYIRDLRNGQGYGNGIIAWDIGAWARAAAMLDDRYGGYATDADDIAEVIWQDSFNDNPGYFDVDDDDGWDPTYTDTNFWWYNLGISGLIDAFVASGTHLAELPGLVQRIQDSQLGNGAISFSYGANAGDEDWQSTAYCAASLARIDHAAYTGEIGGMGDYICDTQDLALTGGWRYATDNHYPEIAGENMAALALAYAGSNEVGPVDPGSCVTPGCTAVDVDITRSEFSDLRGFSVDIQLTGLDLCGDTIASITEGTYLSGIGGTQFQVLDNGGGSYTVDCAILGVPCGQTAASGTLFTVDVESAGVDGTGTIEVTSVTLRDCSNGPLPGIPGSALDLEIDTVPPIAIGNLIATQVKTGNDSDGTTKINLIFTPPGDAAVVEVWRKGFGAYPEYDDDTGTVPTPPTSAADALANGWSLTGVTASGQTDEVTYRDFFYFVAFTRDACGNESAVSNMTTGTLNYHLGDVSDGVTPGQGDNVVGTADVSLLGGNYGIALAFNDPLNFLDWGPTTDFSVDARPLTDNVVNFEELIVLAINFGAVSGPAPRALPQEAVLEDPRLALRIDSTDDSGRLVARLVLDDHRASLVKGIHSVVRFDPDRLVPVSIEQGGLLDGQTAPVFFDARETEAGLVVDTALLGTGLALEGEGVVAEIVFDVKSDGARPELATAVLRDRNNRPAARTALPQDDAGRADDADGIAPAGGPLAGGLVLHGARPNPFDASTSIRFSLPQAGPVTVRIHDVTGRLVRTLLDRPLPAGEAGVTWDGRTDTGSVVAAGTYFYTILTQDQRETRKLLHVR